MMHRPVCVPCGRNMCCVQTGATVHETGESGADMHLWQADIFKCPVCEHEVVVGFGNAPESKGVVDDDRWNRFFEDVTVTFNGKITMLPSDYSVR